MTLLYETVHLLRHTVKKCPQRIKDTPAVLFYCIPCIYTVYFKRLTENMFYDMPLLNIFNVSKLSRMAVGLYRSEICVMHKSRRQNAQGWAGNKSETSFGTKLVLYRCTWTYIGREVHGCTIA